MTFKSIPCLPRNLLCLQWKRGRPVYPQKKKSERKLVFLEEDQFPTYKHNDSVAPIVNINTTKTYVATKGRGGTHIYKQIAMTKGACSQLHMESIVICAFTLIAKPNPNTLFLRMPQKA